MALLVSLSVSEMTRELFDVSTDRARIWSATTAKPLPVWPAWAASMEAFSPSRLVRSATSSMKTLISIMLWAESRILSMEALMAESFSSPDRAMPTRAWTACFLSEAWSPMEETAAAICSIAPEACATSCE